MTQSSQQISQRIAQELGVKTEQVVAAVGLLDDGATVPFISRYRKEVTGGLDDTQMRDLENRLAYLRELEERRTSIIASIEEQGKLTTELKADILNADTKSVLEDLYLPFKKKRRTKGQIAIEAGLLPLAEALLANPALVPENEAQPYLNDDIADTKAALDGAKFILMERFAEDAKLIARLRNMLWSDGQLQSTVVKGKDAEAAKFSDYFEHVEPLAKVPSHRLLAMLRGRNLGFLSLSMNVGEGDLPSPCETVVASHWGIEDQARAADTWLKEVVRWTWRVKLYTHLETDLLSQLRERAETDAIDVFANNLKDLLLAAPAGPRATIGLDPGLRTGVKVAVVDATGKLLDHTAIFPTPPQNRIAESAKTLVALAKKHNVELVAIGNGTASRETERFVKDIIQANPELKLTPVIVNESGASIYSASEFAAREFPDLDVTIRGAISIARRLQDPLAELVKIEPKAIGVGQYQHDVSQTALGRSLEAVVEDCVNAVGVDVNTASGALLSRVSGLSQTVADNIVMHRDGNGAFRKREDLLTVARFGEKTFEQAAGFLRINNGDNLLDASGVHPEAYPVVKKMLADASLQINELVGNKNALTKISPQRYVDDRFGLPTLTDILAELEKPGRDPRPEFKTATLKDGVETLKDLQPDMILEGTVTNVTNFGAFVDVGVHQDGLVHISALSNTFVKDPRTVVKAGDVVKVKVMEVDIPRQRIALSMRLDDKAEPQDQKRDGRGRGDKSSARQDKRPTQSAAGKAPVKAEKMGTMADLFKQARSGGRL